MIRLGLTLRCSVSPRHIWVVLSDPDQTGGKILMVNFTTLRPTTFDRSCILDTHDYDELTQPSVIAFSGSKSGLAAALEMALQEDSFSVIDPQIPEAALQKIIAAARVSSALSPAKKRLLPMTKCYA
jgi:hypothetical protein